MAFRLLDGVRQLSPLGGVDSYRGHRLCKGIAGATQVDAQAGTDQAAYSAHRRMPKSVEEA